nr:PREDICTED: DNA-binding protein RFX5 isoform X1 [Apteryx mantelli mantelli]
MADEESSARATKKGSLSPDNSQSNTTESSMLLQKLKSTISKSVQNKVDSILQDVQKFSDNDKLYLYLQLPSGPSLGEKSSSLDLSSLSAAEYMHACNWIRNHLEEHTDTCLPKQDVYDAYKRYCDNLCCHPLNAANFGKIIREIFPNIKARRLGGRGQSKYCYSGIRRKTVVSLPPLPSLDLKVTETQSELTDLVQSYNSEVMEAACALTCDWAEKILKRSFNNIVEVAQFLIQQHIISSRSAQADLVMAMVVSESMEKIHRDSRSLLTAKKNGLETSESSDRSQGQSKKESGSKPSVLPRPEKKKPPEAPKPMSSPQVNALVARLPLLLPRIQPGDRLVATGAPAVRSSPPVLAPKITATPLGGTVKVAALPLPMGTTSPSLPLGLAPGVNGAAGLVSQQAAVPVINMLLPNVPPGVGLPMAESPANPRSAGGEGQGPSLQDSQRPKATKRSPEPPSDAVLQKRRRGRPRKKLDEGSAQSPEEALSGTEEAAGGSEALRLGSADRAEQEQTVTQGSDISAGSQGVPSPVSREMGDHCHGASPGAESRSSTPGDGTATSHVRDSLAKASLPSQVSVIQDGRSSMNVRARTGTRELEEDMQTSPGKAGSHLDGAASAVGSCAAQEGRDPSPAPSHSDRQAEARRSPLLLPLPALLPGSSAAAGLQCLDTSPCALAPQGGSQRLPELHTRDAS